MAHVEYIVEVLDEKPELAAGDLRAFVLERFTATYNVMEFVDLGFEFDEEDVCTAMLPFCAGKLRSNASSNNVRGVYARGEVVSEYEVDYVRDWVRIYDMLLFSGYVPSDFECRCCGALRDALAAWDAEHPQEAGEGCEA